MKWIKKGIVFKPDGKDWWAKTHAMSPVAIVLNSDTIRVFAGFFDQNGISRIGYVDVEGDAPLHIINKSSNPVIDLGAPGTFDDNGVFPAHVCRINDDIYLYYTGFQLSDKVRYFMFGGLAISKDNGHTFQRASQVPITDRSDEGLYFRGGPCALYENGIFRMWYSSGSQWEVIGGKERPTYDIYYLESPDGIECKSRGIQCIRYNRETEHGLGRPQVIKVNNKYLMFYTRRMKDMRYGSGYSESTDGINWTRKDDQIGIEHSDDGWDSEMVYFPNVVKFKSKYYLFYNGNNFGEEGFGVAELESW
jgi:predicted GH43/DUF377 family glycosyl hydrolase